MGWQIIMAIDPEDKDTGNLLEPLQGKRFVITGKLISMRREDVSKRLRSLGGRMTQTISKRTDYVVLGCRPGGKKDVAMEMGIETISEEGLLELLGIDPMPRLEI